jgi:hypothetical protein
VARTLRICAWVGLDERTVLFTPKSLQTGHIGKSADHRGEQHGHGPTGKDTRCGAPLRGAAEHRSYHPEGSQQYES